MLNIISEYCIKWRCKVSYDKCGVIMFDNRNSNRQEIKYGKCTDKCSCGHHIRFGPKNFINEVLKYPYLGVELDYKLSFTDFNLEW